MKSSGFVAAAVVGVGALWAAPALLWWDPLRLALTPSVAGLGRRGHVALTFDDGPDPVSTPLVLDALDELGWRATFFQLGCMASAHPYVAADVAARGHEIGVHGYDHRGALRRTPRALTDDLHRALSVITDVTGTSPTWYRPPSGELSAGALVAARRVGLRTVLWSAWGRDWRESATPEGTVRDLQSGVLNGGTMLLHDSDCTSAVGSWKTTLAALPLLAEVLVEAGLSVGPLRDHGVGDHS